MVWVVVGGKDGLSCSPKLQRNSILQYHYKTTMGESVARRDTLKT